MSLSRINEVLGSIHIGSIVSQYFTTFKIKIRKRFIKKKRIKRGRKLSQTVQISFLIWKHTICKNYYYYYGCKFIVIQVKNIIISVYKN
jgi:hypothetical protein